MFKQLSQIGKNLSDEFARGVSEDLHPSQDNQSDNNSGLSPDVVLKLKKFEKYEDKYPKLLAAYKGERSKLERAAEIEKVLTENTPISSLDDSESLAAFFKNMNEKQNLLNNEIKRLLTESSNKDGDSQEVQEEQQNTSSLSDRENYENQFNKIKEETLASERRYIDELQELKGKLESTSDDLEKIKTEKESLDENYEKNTKGLQEEIDFLKNELETQKKKSGTIEQLEQENESLRIKIDDSENQLHEKDSKITKLCDEIQQNQKKIEALNRNVSSISNASLSSNTEKFETTSSKSSSKKKKKNAKKSNPITDSTTEVIPHFNGGETENLELQYKEACSKLESNKSNLNADWQTKYDGLKTELENSQRSKNEFKEKLENLEGEYRQLEENLSNSKDTIKEKQSEIEETRDMMKTIGNELVEAKDKLKEFSGVDKEGMIHLENKLKESRTELSSFVTKLAEKEKELDSVSLKANKELDSLRSSNSFNEKQRKQLELRNERLNGDMNRIKSENFAFASQIKEFENLKKTSASLKTTIIQKEKTIIYLEQQVKTYSDNIENTKKMNEELKREKKQLLDRLDNLRRDYEIFKADSQNKSASLEKYIKENGQLSERLSMLQDKYGTLQSLKSNSNEHINSIKRQCEELAIKLKEADKRIISLEDEVTEYSNAIHDKTREINSMKKRISENSTGETAREQELKEKLIYETDERIKLQKELTLQATRKSRDIQDWKQANAELKSELHGLQFKEKELQKDITTLRSLNSNLQDRSGFSKEDSNELEKLATSLKQSLSKADQRVRELQGTNENLMQTNDDVNEKLNRLSKNYKSLSKQLSEIKEINKNGTRTSRTNSIVSDGESQKTSDFPHQSSSSLNKTTLPPETISEMNDKVAYIKNVLLGFLEHKDQRNQLLPVVSTLLRFDSNDEKRLMMSLK